MVGEGGEMHALMKVRVLQDIVPIGAVAQKGNRVSCIWSDEGADFKWKTQAKAELQ